MSPPAAPIAAARLRHAVISWARLIPSARRVPYSAASRKVSRASSWPTMSSPMTPDSAASSHSATACGRIDRWVFTDWAASSEACMGLPCACLLSSCRTAGQSRLPWWNRTAIWMNPSSARCSR